MRVGFDKTQCSFYCKYIFQQIHSVVSKTKKNEYSLVKYSRGIRRLNFCLCEHLRIRTIDTEKRTRNHVTIIFILVSSIY